MTATFQVNGALKFSQKLSRPAQFTLFSLYAIEIKYIVFTVYVSLFFVLFSLCNSLTKGSLQSPIMQFLLSNFVATDVYTLF